MNDPKPPVFAALGEEPLSAPRHPLAAAVVAALTASPEAAAQAAEAVNAFVRSQIAQAYTRRGLPRRPWYVRILPPIAVPPGGVLPPWETGSLLHEIVEYEEDQDAWERRQPPRALWRRLCHQVRFERRVAWWRTRPEAERLAAAHADETAALRPDWTPLADKHRYGLQVAGRLVAQIRTLGACDQ